MPSTATPGSTGSPAGLLPLITDPPASAQAANASDATYSVYQGVVCGIVPRPEYGYTVRYPKIWEAREQGPTTWLADFSHEARDVYESASPAPSAELTQAPEETRLVGAVSATPFAPRGQLDDGLGALLAEGWRSRALQDLRLDPVVGALIGGHRAVRWNLQYTAADGTPMAGYTAAAVVDGRLYRVEIAMAAHRYSRLERAGNIVADQLMIAPSNVAATMGPAAGTVRRAA